jgi:hypothetical protein
LHFLFVWLQPEDNAGFLRAARAGHIDKVLEYLKANTDINTANTVRAKTEKGQALFVQTLKACLGRNAVQFTK